jgi:hypothetical protein
MTKDERSDGCRDYFSPCMKLLFWGIWSECELRGFRARVRGGAVSGNSQRNGVGSNWGLPWLICLSQNSPIIRLSRELPHCTKKRYKHYKPHPKPKKSPVIPKSKHMITANHPNRRNANHQSRTNSKHSPLFQPACASCPPLTLTQDFIVAVGILPSVLLVLNSFKVYGLQALRQILQIFGAAGSTGRSQGQAYC